MLEEVEVKKKTERKSKYNNIKIAKKYAWEALSLYVRTRDKFKCFTCDFVGNRNNIDAGHYIPATHSYLRFNENNVHAQCTFCNKGLEGNRVVYRPRMIEKYGLEFVEKLEESRFTVDKKTINDYNQIEIFYKSELEKLNSL